MNAENVHHLKIRFKQNRSKTRQDKRCWIDHLLMRGEQSADYFHFNILFDCIHQDVIYIGKGEATARQMGHLRGEINEKVGKTGRKNAVGQLSINNKDKSLQKN